MKQPATAILCCLLLWAPAHGASTPPPSPQQAILEIAIGAPVEVKLRSGPKFRGRLEQVRDDGFDVKVANKNELETRSLAFQEVKSVKPLREGEGGRIALYMLAGIGAFMLVLYSIAFAIAG